MSSPTTENRQAQAIDLEQANRALEGDDAERIIRWAVEAFAPRLAVSSSFGGESACLLHLATRVWPRVPVLFVNTGFLFDETLKFRDELVARLDLNLLEFTPKVSAERFAAEHGPLWRTDPDACCLANKVEPMERAIVGFDGWLSGIRRDQSSHRAGTPIVRRLDGGLFKVSPIAAWTTRQVHDYLARHKLPFHPLFEKGYLSIGCTHCTRPVLVGADARSGRWNGTGKTECGLHTRLGSEKKPGSLK